MPATAVVEKEKEEEEEEEEIVEAPPNFFRWRLLLLFRSRVVMGSGCGSRRGDIDWRCCCW